MHARRSLGRRESIRRLRSTSGREHSRGQYLTQLRLEPLEDRRMLSVLMVDADAPAGGNGLAWATAYNDLQPALAQAAALNADAEPANDVDQIWIAEGTYKPSALLKSGSARSAAFSLVNGVTLYGGFAGTETTLDERDWSSHVTTLSGDLGTTGFYLDNAYKVVYCQSGVTSGIDGISITDAYGNGSSFDRPEGSYGGGIYNEGTLTVTASTLSANSVNDKGGGIYNAGTLTVTDSIFSDNEAWTSNGCGGGIYSSGTATVIRCRLSGHSAGNGSAIYSSLGTMTIVDSTLWGNSASTSGGGVYSWSSTLTVINSTLWGNSANTSGGGIYSSACTLIVTNSTISANSADGDGGGIYTVGTLSTATLNNTIVAANSASPESDFYLSSGALSGSSNLIGNGSGQTALVDGVDGNQVGTMSSPIDPLLSDWTEYDSDVWGYYLLPGSSAVDAGNNTLAVGPDGLPLTQDILGNARIQNGIVDLGAVEGATEGNTAQTYTVTSLDNTIAVDGEVTFIEAFDAARRNRPAGDAPAGSFGQEDVIRFAEGVSGTALIDDGQLEIMGDLRIEGPGSELLTLRADGDSRVLFVWPNVSANLSRMTITGGQADLGGGIYNSGSLILADLVISTNSATAGGAIYNSSFGAITAHNSMLSNNSASNSGGGISNSGALTITDCVLSGNAAVYGGGIHNYSGFLEINDSTLSSNTGHSGGGVYSMNTLTITGSTLSDNTATDGNGGGIFSASPLTILRSTFFGNSTTGSNFGCGGGIYSTNTLTVASSTFSGNLATGSYGYGGALYGYSGTLTVTNTTISSNSAMGNSYGCGGGIYGANTLTVANSTVSNNSAIGGSSDYGGGICISGSSATATLNNTIVAGNGASSGMDIYRSSGTLSGSYNLIGDGSGQTQLVNGVNGNQVGTTAAPIDPKLGAARRLLPGSPAINKGSNALAVDAAGNPLAVDLDGKPRIIYGTVDVGAYEYCLVADVDYSGTVDAGDAQVLASHWGLSDMAWADGDFNGDGRVNAADAAILAANWGATFTPPSESQGPAGESAAAMVGPMPAGSSGGARRLVEPVAERSTKDEGRRTKEAGGDGNEPVAVTVGQAVPDAPNNRVAADSVRHSLTYAVDRGEVESTVRHSLTYEVSPDVQRSIVDRLAWWHTLARRQPRRPATGDAGLKAAAVDLVLGDSRS